MFKHLKSLYHKFLAYAGAIVYQYPSRQITVIGITGTKGKSTTAEALASVLEAAGYPVALLSSVHVKIDKDISHNITGNTMPGRFFIQRWLREAVRAGCRFAILEVTSQGVVGHRHEHIDFDVAAMTCLHAEHIESHGSFDKYRAAKVKFFADTAARSQKPKKIFVINSDSEHAPYFKTAANGSGEIVYFSREEFVKDELSYAGLSSGHWLSSNFNLENAAAVAAICRALGIPAVITRKALADFKGVPGRYEWLDARTNNGAFSVVIDYAHTPGSFEALLKALKDKKPTRLIAVFGSYGEGRDRWKRPQIGTIAETYCDKMYLTNEGPGDEHPQTIVDQIASGITDKLKIIMILDRRNAIKAALEEAKEGDIVALIGKGHESYIRIGKHKIPWNERQVAEEVLAGL